MNASLKVLMLGDLFGKTGRKLFARHIKALREQHDLDAVIVNGENCAEGKGITPDIVKTLKEQGATVVTTGNHVWDKKEIIPFMSEHDTVLRPANYPACCPGTGMTFFNSKNGMVAVINLMGRIAMPVHVENPFEEAARLVEEARAITPYILIDFHAEVSAEKQALAHFLDGKITALVGTHTHVPTADAMILPGGTGYLSDLGMAGSYNSMIGAKKEVLINRLLTQMPAKHEVDTQPPFILSGALITIECKSGKTKAIEPLVIIDDEPL